MTMFYEKNNEKNNEKTLDLTELVDFLDQQVDFNDIESIKESAPFVQRISNDTNWYIELLNKEIELNVLSDKEFKNQYTSNSTLLGRSKVGKPYFLRTNIWLPESNSLRSGMSKSFFAEDFYHDHSFDLLTVGLLGSGYTTNIRNYDHKSTIGYKEEVVETSETEQYRLESGTALFMEKHKTIHQQIAPKDTSVSFNIMLDNIKYPKSRQYEFETLTSNKMKIRSIHHNGYRFSASIEYLITMACNFYDDNTKDYLIELYNKLIVNPSDHEPTIILLRSWFKKVGITNKDIFKFDFAKNQHLRYHFEQIETEV